MYLISVSMYKDVCYIHTYTSVRTLYTMSVYEATECCALIV